MINIMGVNLEEKLFNQLAVALLPQSINLFNARNKDEAKKILYTKVIDFILGDLTKASDIDTLDFFKWVRSLNIAREHKFICLLDQKPSEPMVKQMMSLNVSGIILKKLTIEEIIIKINNVINKHSGKGEEKRQHIRVGVQRKENLKVKIPIVNTDKVVEAYVRNISLGGIAFELDNQDDDELFIRGQLINNAKIILNEKEIDLDAKVVMKKYPIAAIQFMKLDSTAWYSVAKYIHDKIIDLG